MPAFNPIAIIIASLIPLIVGSVWYLPSVMGTMLTETEGKSSESHGHPTRVYLLTILFSALIAIMLSAIMSTHDPEEITLLHGMFHGGIAALFLGTPPFIIIALFDNKPQKYILIHITYWILSMILMGGIIGIFGV